MENNLKIVEAFEMQQLESFNNNEKVKMLEKLSSKLSLELRSKIELLENFNPKECKKRKLVHSGYLVFEVSCDGSVVIINNDDFGLLSWAEVITELKATGEYKLFKWDTEYSVTRNWEVSNELLFEIDRITKFLQNFNNKSNLISYLEEIRKNKRT